MNPGSPPLKGKGAAPVSFLPVPVAINPKVRRAFNSAPMSHRSAGFTLAFDDCRRMLLDLTGAAGVELFIGSGTLANDVVAAQLSLLDSKGLVLANGEFGDRLADHALRHGLDFESITAPWGTGFDYAAVESRVAEGNIGWLWAVHCETFTGTANSLEKLADICRKHDVRLCLDCISSVGIIPVRLDGVFLATTVSGKGLGAYPGISMVFYNHDVAPGKRLPRYLDLGHYRQKKGVPFTHSSNLVAALREALLLVTATPKYERIRRESAWLGRELERAGISVVSATAQSPAVLTIAMPPSVSSVRLGEEMETEGFLLGYRTEFLVNNNWLRICLMGDTSRAQHRRMLQALVDLYQRHL